LWETDTTSTPRSESFEVAQLVREPVATFGLVAPAGLRGFSARPERTVPLNEIARKVWLRMIQDGLLTEKMSSELFSSD